MRDALGWSAGRADLHELRVAHHLVSHPHDIVGHRGRKEERLPRGRVGKRHHDAADVGPESHVHHAIRLVQHERVELVESDRAAAHVIHQSARRGHDDVDARAERPLLRVHRHAAVDGDAGQIRVVGEPLDVVLDLHAELARGREDEDAGKAALFRGSCARLQDSVQDRQQKRRRFAGAGLGATDQVVAVHDNGNDRALNRSRGQEPADPNALDEGWVESKRFESHWPRVVFRLRALDDRLLDVCRMDVRRMPARRVAAHARLSPSSARVLRLGCMGTQNVILIGLGR